MMWVLFCKDITNCFTRFHAIFGYLTEFFVYFLVYFSDRNGITFVVIHCDDVDAVLQRLPNHVCYIVEYLVRFVSRLKIGAEKQSTLMMRFVASLTHQSVVIKGTTFPDAKLQFSKLRGGTADSTLKFMLRYVFVR